MRSIVTAFRRLRELVGSERRWRWPLLLGLALIVTLFEAVGAVLVFVLLGLMVTTDSTVVLPVLGDLNAAFPDRDLRSLQVAAAIAIGVFFLLRLAVLITRSYVQNRIVHNAGALVAGRLLRGYLAMPYLFHTRRNSAELVRNTTTSTQQMVRQALRPAVDVVAESILVLGLSVVLVVISPAATLLAVLVLLPTVLLLQRSIQPRLQIQGRRSQEASRASISIVQQSLGGIRDLKLLRRERAFTARHLDEQSRLARAHYLSQTLIQLPRPLIETALVVTLVVAFTTVVVTGTGVQESMSVLGLFAYAGLRLQPSLQKIVESTNQLRYSHAVLEDLVADTDLLRRGGPPSSIAAMSGGPEARRVDTGAREFHDRITMVDVGFSYAAHAEPALTDVNLVIRKGEFVGVCGPTGGGKSTLVDVITGLLEPTHGQVMIDDRVLDAEPVWWWEQLGVVHQDSFLIDDSLRANIALGTDRGDIDEASMQRCVELAQLGAVVRRLPDGLDTLVGERGVKLSGGQRQRVAIARALYQEPSVLVLDEGTSALDTETERSLVNALDERPEGRTLIAVAHRLSTIRGADRILIVADGKVNAQGSYEELRRGSALFRDLAR